MNVLGAARLLICIVCFGWTASQAQQPLSRDAAANRTIHLNVQIAQKSGEPITGLEQSDFTLLDNKAPRAITSFRAASSRDEKVKVILLIDAVNVRFQTVAYEREQMRAFLHADGGHLANPTTIAVLMDKGVQILPGFSTDGNMLSETLDNYTIGLRDITRSAGFWGADERLKLSLTAMNQLATFAASQPGRKMLMWISPGWPLLSGPGIQLNGKQEDEIFGNIVRFSTLLRQANVTLYDLNPLGPGENLERADYYEAFLKGVSKSQQSEIGNLGLQVLALQSGGLTLEGSSDIAGILRKCLRDADGWYEITFEAAVAEQPNEYHHIEVRLDKPGPSARTREGYYAQP